MLFPTLSFAAFFAVVLPVSWLLMPHRIRWRLFIVAVSWIFYGAADWRFVPLLAGSTVANHFFARRIHRASGPLRKVWTTGAVVVNLAVLGWFKYVGFLSLTLQSSLRWMGIHAHVPLPEVLLPIGISFFTFQALSYVIDTARGKVRPVSLLEFAVYLSFFPHLVAGPIVRATEFLPQIKERLSPRSVGVSRAFWLISMGLFKKVVIASYLGTYAADPLFGFPRQHAGVEALLGVYAYAIQIYADFSGYTDIAIGLALLLGVQFPQNFNAPYAAASLQDFWRRWHMTLSRWLRDYLYIPLGGNRRGRVRTCVNIMITMLLGGLWHGAAWTFVAWGALHGIGLVVERLRHEKEEVDKGVTPVAAGPPSPPARELVAAGSRQSKVSSLPRGERFTVRVPPPAVAVGSLDVPASTPVESGAASPVESGGASPVAPAPSPSSVADEAKGAATDQGDEQWRPSTSRPAGRPTMSRSERNRSGPRRPRPLRAVRVDPPGGELAEVDDRAVMPDDPVSGAATWDELVLGHDAMPRRSAPVAPPPTASDAPLDTSASAARATPPSPLDVTQQVPSAATAGRSLPGDAATQMTDDPYAPPPPRRDTAARVPATDDAATRLPPSPPPTAPRSELSPTARLWLGRLVTFHVVCLAWIFFRATSFHNAIQVLGRIAAVGGHHRPFNWKVAAVVAGALAVQLGPRGVGVRLQALFSRSSIWVQALGVAGVLTVIDLLGPAGVAPFIYFRF